VAVALLGALEARTGVTGTALELQVETAPAVVDADGRITVPLLLAAGRGRVTGLHFGTYDYTAALGLSPREQALDAPVADAAKDLLQLSAAARGVAVSDGSSNVLPVGDRAQVHAAWALHARLVERGRPAGCGRAGTCTPDSWSAAGPPSAPSSASGCPRCGPGSRARRPVWRTSRRRGRCWTPSAAGRQPSASPARQGAMSDTTAPAGLGVAGLNGLPAADAERALLACCRSPAWARAVAAGRPYADAEAVLVAADAALAALAEDEVDAALAGHPRIGERTAAASFSRGEQAGLDGSAAAVREALAAGNRAYEERFGHVYLVCATGRSGEELLAVLQERLAHEPAHERTVLREELRRINRVRLSSLVGATG
jgi:2-oxo-4-hydroxy-4-carboxy-5-ureidoimidazoline decarboxylase